jgi:hypothetical protein
MVVHAARAQEKPDENRGCFLASREDASDASSLLSLMA